MPSVIAFVSQKGGVGKSTLARGLAREAANSGLDVKLADLDTQQGTCADWHRERLKNGHDSVGSVEIYASAKQAIKKSGDEDILIIDGAPRASEGTLEIAKNADLVILPSCSSRDDLIPAIKLAYELEKNGTLKKAIAFALTRVTTEAEIAAAREAIEESGYQVLDGCLYEKPTYRLAQNQGLAVTETRVKSLNQKADLLFTSMVNLLLKD